uniref:Putative zn finger n=1 Tax=Lutzomyia longipalpis TaxID=7200 RepID=A0A1B0CR73_LUTLO
MKTRTKRPRDGIFLGVLSHKTVVELEKINKDDKLPQQICHDCTTKFIAANDIRRLAIESDCFLKGNLRKLLKEPQEDGSEVSLQKPPSWVDEQQELKKTRNAEITEAERNQISCDGNKEDEDHEETLGEFSCETCGKVFQSHLSMRRHTKYHLLDRIKCPLCPRNFSQMSNLKRHLIVHSDMKEFHCDRCSELFGSISALYEHIKNHINTPDSTPSDYVMRCEVCRDFSTASYVEFRNHMRREHQVSGTIRPFICCIWNLTAHMMIHSGKKPYICSLCFKSFAQGSKLRQHMDKKHPN